MPRWVAVPRSMTFGTTRGAACLGAVSAGVLPLQGRMTPVASSTLLAVPVVVAGALGGELAALALAALGAFVLAIVLPPLWAPAIDSPGDLALLVAYVVLAVAAGVVVARAARAQRAAVAERRAAGAGVAGGRGAGAPVAGAWVGSGPSRSTAEPLRPLSAYFGHHKCATSWIGDILDDFCGALGWSHWAVDNAGPFGHIGIEQWAFRNRIDVVTYTNADIRWVPWREDLRAFHVIRDPRDVCVSAYFSHLESHPLEGWPELAELRRRLRSVDLGEGLSIEIDFLSPVFEAMASWDYARPTVLELRFEDLVADPIGRFLEITRFLCMSGSDRVSVAPGALGALQHFDERLRRLLHLPSPRGLRPEQVADIVRRHDFPAKTGGRERGVEDRASHYRLGVPGEWRLYFQPRHIEQFGARYPGLLRRLGYER